MNVLGYTYKEKKSGTIAAAIIFFLLFVGVGIGVSFLIYYISDGENTLGIFIANLICILLAVLVLCLIVSSYFKTNSFPDFAIKLEDNCFVVLTKSGYSKIKKEEIKKVNCENTYAPIAAGKAMIPVKLSYGDIKFILKDGTKIISVKIVEVKACYQKVLGEL